MNAPPKTHLYGDRTYFVRTPGNMTHSFEADSVIVTDSGALIALGGWRKIGEAPEEANRLLMAWNVGEWIDVYASSAMDGTAVALIDSSDSDDISPWG